VALDKVVVVQEEIIQIIHPLTMMMKIVMIRIKIIMIRKI